MDTDHNHGNDTGDAMKTTHYRPNACGGRKVIHEIPATVRILKTRGGGFVLEVLVDETGEGVVEEITIDPKANGVLQDWEVALGVELGAKWESSR